VSEVEDRIASIVKAVPDMSPEHAERLFRCYGTRTGDLLGDARRVADLGEDFGGGLSRREVDYLIAAEWAKSAEDILWRRTKIGLRINDEQRQRLAAYVQGRDVEPRWSVHAGSRLTR
jgi:glycerol-3-phosphate dehydrogenase